MKAKITSQVLHNETVPACSNLNAKVMKSCPKNVNTQMPIPISISLVPCGSWKLDVPIAKIKLSRDPHMEKNVVIVAKWISRR